jgi:cyanophycinase
MSRVAKGYLIIIGGAEDKNGESLILKQAPEMMEPQDKLTILTTATEHPEEVGKEYQDVFSRIGMKNIHILNINTRADANDPKICEEIRDTTCIFLTGGDQLRLTSILGGTETYNELRNVYYSGGIIMGTSAGASVMSSTMVVQGTDNEPAKKCTLKMAPGLGFFEGTIIDQHFDQRGRFGRLLCGVAENPGVLGIGIDEDTAIKLFPDKHFEILGSNTVTVIDGNTIKSSNVSELAQNEMLAIIGVTVHTLPAGYGYNMHTREVLRLKRNS